MYPHWQPPELPLLTILDPDDVTLDGELDADDPDDPADDELDADGELDPDDNELLTELDGELLLTDELERDELLLLGDELDCELLD